MEIAGFDVQYLSHVCFVFTSYKGGVLVTDPLFASGFVWKGKFERYLTPPAIAVDAIKRCHAVFVSHIHGDHFDPEAIEKIVANTGARVLAPPDVIDALRERGLRAASLVPLCEGLTRRLPGMTVTAYAGYDKSFDDKGRPNKFALLLRSAGWSVFYSGDCHEAPPALIGREVDAVFAWPHPKDGPLRRFAGSFKMKQYVLMHGDRFKPGNFWCNFSYEKEKRRIERLLPGLKVVIPKRVNRLR